MNIEKLEAILGEMRQARFTNTVDAGERVQRWADRIGGAITEHLVDSLGGSAIVPEVPALSGEPGGHGWDSDGGWRVD